MGQQHQCPRAGQGGPAAAHPQHALCRSHPQLRLPQDWPGTANAKPSTVFAPAPIWTVVHLHGGSTPPGSDGYPDDAFPPGDQAVYTYDGQPRASLLWYDDHADMITRLNVQAGLAGMYIVRDEVEDALKLPRGGQHELPLLIQDRNLDVDEATVSSPAR